MGQDMATLQSSPHPRHYCGFQQEPSPPFPIVLWLGNITITNYELNSMQPLIMQFGLDKKVSLGMRCYSSHNTSVSLPITLTPSALISLVLGALLVGYLDTDCKKAILTGHTAIWITGHISKFHTNIWYPDMAEIWCRLADPPAVAAV